MYDALSTIIARLSEIKDQERTANSLHDVECADLCLNIFLCQALLKDDRQHMRLQRPGVGLKYCR